MTLNQRFYHILSAASLGILSVGLQVLFLRSLLDVFQGNELTIGLFLSVWLLGSAIGSLLFSKLIDKLKLQKILEGGVFPLAILEYFIIKFIPAIFQLIPGGSYDILTIFKIILISILPLTIWCGALFPFLAGRLISRTAASSSAGIKLIYIWESAGSLVIAVLLNFLLFGRLQDIRILFLVLFIFFLSRLLMEKSVNGLSGQFAVLFSFTSAGLLLLLFGYPLMEWANQKSYPYYTVRQEQDTPYGHVKVLYLEQEEFLLNQGVVIFSTPDPVSVESSVLIPLLSHAGPERVLFIGGNISEFVPYLRNILTVKEVTYLEKDPFLMKFQKDRLNLSRSDSPISFSFIMDDGRTFFLKNNKPFDVICLNEPEPYTLSDNRFYSREFYRLIASSLTDDGIYFFSVRASENYIHAELCNYLNLLRNTLNGTFRQVFFIPGDEAYFLAGNSPDFIKNLQNWSGRLLEYPVKPRFLTSAYVSYLLSPGRLDSFREQMQKCKVSFVNRDFNLKGYLYHFQLWSGVSDPALQSLFHFLNSNRIAMVLIILILVTTLQLLMRRHARSLMLLQLFFAGGLSISLEILIILQYQILYGTIYSRVAIIFGLFMAGLAAGAVKPVKDNLNFRYLFAAYALLSAGLLLPVILTDTVGMRHMQGLIFQWMIFPLEVFLTGWIGGRFFSGITHRLYLLCPNRSYGITYGIDLIGGVGAALITSVFFVPLLGFTATILLLAAISMLPVIFA